MSSPVITVSIHDKIDRITDLMRIMKIGSVVVLDNNTNPVGIITERDIVRRIASKNLKPSDVEANKIMSKQLKIIDPRCNLLDAAKAMRNLGVRRLIVIEDSKLIGIITSDDIVKIIPDLITIISVESPETYPEAFEKLFNESANLSKGKGIDRQVIQDSFQLSYDCALKEEEGRPTSTGIIIGDPSKILKYLEITGRIILPKNGIKDSRNYLKTLFGVVDGFSSAFIVDKKGNIAEVGLFWPLPQNKTPPTSLIAPRYKHYMYITKIVSDSLAIFSFGKLRVVKLFEGGSLVAEASFSWKEGRWIFRSYNKIKDTLQGLSVEKELNFDVLCKCFSLAVEMSNRRLGGTFLIGDHDKILEQSEKPLIFFENANLLDFNEENEEYIINLASKDFATILDSQGIIAGSSTRLLAKPPPGVSVEVSSEDGGRHRSAAEMSSVAKHSVAIVISEDGPITIYSHGRRILRV